MLSSVVCIGRVVRDPDLRYTPGGKAVANFTLAINRQGKDKEADFIDHVVWDQLAEIVANWAKKGRLVATEGRLQARTYEARDGGKRKAVEVVAYSVKFLDQPKDDAAQNGEGDEDGA